MVGLSSADAQRRLTEFGPNEIRREQATKALTLLVRQFASPVIGLFLVATVLSAALGEWLDAIAIGAIVILNAIIGFFQEHRAERAVMALRSMTAPRARVMREGHSVMMPANAIATTPNGARAHLLETLGNRTLIERRRRERRR